MGTKGVRNTQFAREIYASPRPPLNVTNINDKDLNIFIRDSPFNFTLEQALEKLEDPSTLAEVAQLHTWATRIPVYSELARVMQEFSDAMHKFQKDFSNRTGRVVFQFEATKRHMEAAQIHSCVQLTLIELAREQKLQGQFY